jgi:hypothetical protein
MKVVKFLIILLVLVGAGYLFVDYYPFIFARTVTGEVVSVERLDTPVAVMGGQTDLPKQVFSFAIGIEDKKTGEIVVASSEDRRWAAVVKGNCATARFFPYAPWRLDKRGMYFDARLVELLKNCDTKKEQ